MNRALLIVDVQNDFCEGGTLAVSGGHAVAERIADYVRTVCPPKGNTYNTVIASRDNHKSWPDTNCGHFSEKPDFVKSWPRHCEANTKGADFEPHIQKLFEDKFINHVVYKGYGAQSYSAFEAATTEGVGLLGILRSHDIDTIDMVGIATDYCVKASLSDALSLGYDVRVLQKMTAAVRPDEVAKIALAVKTLLVVPDVGDAEWVD